MYTFQWIGVGLCDRWNRSDANSFQLFQRNAMAEVFKGDRRCVVHKYRSTASERATIETSACNYHLRLLHVNMRCWCCWNPVAAVTRCVTISRPMAAKNQHSV